MPHKEEKKPHTAFMVPCEKELHGNYCPECWDKCPHCGGEAIGKCQCACHDNILKKPYEHDTVCCEAMNGTVWAENSHKPRKEESVSDIQCPTCGYYCLGKGGVGCIDKPSMYKIPLNAREIGHLGRVPKEEKWNLAHCDKCNYMTNHREKLCLKCYGTPTPPQSDWEKECLFIFSGVIFPRNSMEDEDVYVIDKVLNYVRSEKEKSYEEGKREEREIVICAAVKCSDGTIIRGHRHGSAMWTVREMKKELISDSTQQGFITSRNRYVSREDGRKLQDAAGIASVDPEGYRGTTLFSEDLY